MKSITLSPPGKSYRDDVYLMRYFVDMDCTPAKWNNVEFEQLFKKGYYRNLEPNRDMLEEVRTLVKQNNMI